MPVEPEVFYRCNVAAAELAPVSPEGKPEQDADSDDHMHGVHTGHGEVEREKDLGTLRHVRCERLFILDAVSGGIDELRDVEVRARDVVLLPLLVVLDILDP